MNLLKWFLTWPIVPMAIIWSIGYGLFAIRIFFKKDQVDATKSAHPSWKIHQFWLNFLGSIVGWIITYFLLSRIEYLWESDYSYTISFADVFSFLLAFIGITGFLPMTVVGLVNAVSSLAEKIIELISKQL